MLSLMLLLLPLLALTAHAVKRRALPLRDLPNYCAALSASLSSTIIDEVALLKIARLSVCANKIAQGTATMRNRGGKRQLNLAGKPTVSAQRNAPGLGFWMNPRAEQTLGGIDVTDTNHDITGQQHLLDCRSTPACACEQQLRQRCRLQWFDTQAAQQQVLIDRAVLLRVPEHRAKAARIVHPHQRIAENQIEVIVFFGWC